MYNDRKQQYIHKRNGMFGLQECELSKNDNYPICEIRGLRASIKIGPSFSPSNFVLFCLTGRKETSHGGLLHLVHCLQLIMGSYTA